MNCKVCGNTSVKNTSLSFFRFPKENDRCKIWAERCNMLNLYEKHGTLRFYKSFRICSDHFNPKDIVFDGRKKRLLQSAMPQVFITNQNLKEEKLEDMDNLEHSEIFQLNLAENLCRLCAEENKNLTDIYGWKGRILNLEAKLKYFPLMINKYDVLPLKVCSQCISKISQIHDFILNCVKAETKLRIMLDLKDCDASYKSIKSNAECQEKVDWSSEMKTNLKEMPNFDSLTKVHDSFDPMACFSANVEDNYYNQILKDDFINENDSSCFLKQPELDFANKKQLSGHTNFIREVDFSENISFEHDYSNVVLRDQLQSELKNHSEIDQNFSDETKHPCNIFLESFNNTETPNAHSITHSVESELFTELFCEACNKFFFSRFELDEHTSQHFEGSFLCKICDKKFHKVAFLKKHLFDHKVNNSCDYSTNLRCPQVCLKSDDKTRLQGFSQCDRNKPSLFCDSNQKNSKVEKKNVKSQKRRFCVMFSNNRQVCITHEKSHVGETSYNCKQCGKTFRSRQSLRQHGSVHSDKRLYSCEECGMSFKRKDTLGNHLRIHTGERPFVCKVCGFAFKQRGDCIKHEKNHQNKCKADVKGNNLKTQIQVDERLTFGSSPIHLNTRNIDYKKIKGGELKDFLKLNHVSECPSIMTTTYCPQPFRPIFSLMKGVVHTPETLFGRLGLNSGYPPAYACSSSIGSNSGRYSPIISQWNNQ